MERAIPETTTSERRAMELVVNEWLPEYLRPDAPPEHRRKAVQFLHVFDQRSDTLVVKRDSEFSRKIYRYAKDFAYDMKSKDLYKQLVNRIFRDSRRCTLLGNAEITPLPDILTALLHAPYDSDTYLFEAAWTTQDRIILTTDERLATQMAGNGVIAVTLLDDFLARYTA
jgi:uncharacterized protein with PIN domain